MSDEAVVKNFAGIYSSDGWALNGDPTKATWFPGPGIVMELVPYEDAAGWHMRVEFKEKGEELPHAEQIAAARYSVVGDRLMSTPLLLAENLAAVEVLSLDDAGEVLHKVVFSDWIVGFWRCRP
jgi:hypothetical protein